METTQPRWLLRSGPLWGKRPSIIVRLAAVEATLDVAPCVSPDCSLPTASNGWRVSMFYYCRPVYYGMCPGLDCSIITIIAIKSVKKA